MNRGKNEKAETMATKKKKQWWRRVQDELVLCIATHVFAEITDALLVIYYVLTTNQSLISIYTDAEHAANFIR